MAKRVICECPNCGVETIVDKAVLVRDPLFECPECEATMEVDLAPPPDQDVGPETLASPESSADVTPAEPPAPPREDRPAPRERKLIAKTQPMVPYSGHAAEPAPPPATSRAPSVGPLALVMAGVLGLGGGWLARGLAARDDGLRQTVQSYCAGETSAQSARDMCDHLLGAR